MFDIQFKYCLEIDYPNAYHVESHTHPCHELVYYYQGHGEFSINNEKKFYESDCVYIVPPYSHHEEWGEASTKVYVLGFTIDTKKSILLPKSILKGYQDKLIPYFQLLLTEVKRESVHCKHTLDLLTEAVVFKFFDGKELEVEAQDIVKNIAEYIKENCSKKLAMKEVAASFGYSYGYFRRLFVKYMHLTADRYKAQEQFKLALYYVNESNKSVKEIALLCGYSSTSHFTSLFKDKMGLTVTEYRAKKFNKESFINDYFTFDGKKENKSDN